MEQYPRSVLAPGAQLRLMPVDTPEAAAQWEIIDLIGQGGSSICYGARSGRKSGRLKEFYPVGFGAAPLFQRLGDGTLQCVSAHAGKLCEEFLRAYEVLEEIKREDAAAELLNNFIPPYRLLRGKEDGTVYVWTPDDKQGVAFESYLQKLWKKPEKSPEHKLYHILDAVLTLADCVRVLHRAGLLHLDIKPSNFLVLYDGDFNINPGSISLFDIDTLCLAGSGVRAAGSQGYCAPEVPRGRADNRSDIYSMGAMLFRALLNRHYGKEDYADLKQFLVRRN